MGSGCRQLLHRTAVATPLPSKPFQATVASPLLLLVVKLLLSLETAVLMHLSSTLENLFSDPVMGLPLLLLASWPDACCSSMMRGPPMLMSWMLLAAALRCRDRAKIDWH